MSVDDMIFAIKNMELYKLKVSDYIDLMMMWYRDILMLKVSNNPGRLMFKEYYSDIRKQSSHISYEGIERYSSLWTRPRSDLRRMSALTLSWSLCS